MMRPQTFFRVAALALLALAALALSDCQGRKLRHQLAIERHAHELTRINAEADLDSTRVLWLNERDRSVGYERLMHQLALRADSLDKLLGQESKARIAAEFRLRDVRVQVASPPARTDSAGVRSAAVITYQRPFTIRAAVDLPLPPDSARWTFDVLTDPVAVSARIACATGPSPRHARIQIEAPDYLAVHIGSVVQDTDVCSPPPPPPRSQRSRLAAAAVLGFLIGVAVTVH
jgi:hypothetical protein